MSRRPERSELDASKRERLFDRARALWRRHGPIRLSMDQVTREAAVSKRTLYKYYKSRDAFIAALIDYDAEQWREWFWDAVAGREMDTQPGIQAFLDVLRLWLASDGFRGVLFAGAPFAYQGAMPDCIATTTRRHVDLLRGLLAEHLRASGVRDPEGVAAQVLAPVLVLLSGVADAIPGTESSSSAQSALMDLLHGVLSTP